MMLNIRKSEHHSASTRTSHSNQAINNQLAHQSLANLFVIIYNQYSVDDDNNASNDLAKASHSSPGNKVITWLD